MKKIQKKRKGFTLIELVVVIVIIAILAAVALLSFGNFTKTATDSRIKSEHSQIITAGNMWRATETDPNLAPSMTDVEKFMETDKPILEEYHTLEEGVLVSTLTDGTTKLTYDFNAK